jgi:hypothetical protein
VIITFRKSNKASSAPADVETVALLTKFTQYNCGRSCLLDGVLARKLLKCHGGCCCLVLPEFEDLFYTPYLLSFPTNK